MKQLCKNETLENDLCQNVVKVDVRKSYVHTLNVIARLHERIVSNSEANQF